MNTEEENANSTWKGGAINPAAGLVLAGLILAGGSQVWAEEGQVEGGEGQLEDLEAAGEGEGAARRAVSILPPTEEERRRYFYGPLQMRSGEVFEELKEEILECLDGMGSRGVFREFSFEAKREDLWSGFEVARVKVHPEEEGERGCAEELAGRFAAYVGSGVWDGFDAYAVAVGRRPEPGRCEESGGCVSVGNLAEERIREEERGACGEELAAAVQGALRRQRQQCFSPREHREIALMGDPLESRALVIGELAFVEREWRVALHVNRGWVREAAECMLKGLEALEFSKFGDENCRHELTNHGITYSDKPVFSFVE